MASKAPKAPKTAAGFADITLPDYEGNDVRLELEGLPARIAQHELDHLDGVLILDRTTPEARREALGLLRPQPILVR